MSTYPPPTWKTCSCQDIHRLVSPRPFHTSIHRSNSPSASVFLRETSFMACLRLIAACGGFFFPAKAEAAAAGSVAEQGQVLPPHPPTCSLLLVPGRDQMRFPHRTHLAHPPLWDNSAGTCDTAGNGKPVFFAKHLRFSLSSKGRTEDVESRDQPLQTRRFAFNETLTYNTTFLLETLHFKKIVGYILLERVILKCIAAAGKSYTISPSSCPVCNNNNKKDDFFAGKSSFSPNFPFLGLHVKS